MEEINLLDSIMDTESKQEILDVIATDTTAELYSFIISTIFQEYQEVLAELIESGMDTYTLESVDASLNRMTDAQILDIYLLMFNDNPEKLELLNQKVSEARLIAK
jgi:hypothetical protein